MPKMTEERARDKAKREYEEEGRVEIDLKAPVSRGDNGYYVQAWVWVYDDEDEED